MFWRCPFLVIKVIFWFIFGSNGIILCLIVTERLFLAGPTSTAVVELREELRITWRKPNSPSRETTTYQYIVRMPDGSSEILSFPVRKSIGDHMEIGYKRGRVSSWLRRPIPN